VPAAALDQILAGRQALDEAVRMANAERERLRMLDAAQVRRTPPPPGATRPRAGDAHGVPSFDEVADRMTWEKDGGGSGRR
jgi:hypothetical protein